jgi:hypothetical protein
MNETLTSRRREYLSLLVLPLYIAACLLVLPAFKEIIDPDDTAYLKIADRYASGNWRLAINGMWSPLNSWIAALFLPITGLKSIMLFKYLNIVFGSIGVLAVRALLQKSGIAAKHHFPALLGLLPFFIYATYHELGVDWLQCVVLLLYINLIFSPKYPRNWVYPVLCGVLGVLAYYAKYYNFHFFWLHFIVANFFWFYKWEDRKLGKRFWLWSATGIGVLILLAVPWVLLLHTKYGFYKLNYTGAFDLAWSLDQKVLTKHTRALLQPTLPGAASFLEDPIWHKHKMVHPFSSFALFRRQVAISLLAFTTFFEAMQTYSALFAAVAAYYLFRFFKGGYRLCGFDTFAVLVCIVMPSGYFLFHFEPRFLWPVCILGYILGLKLIERQLWPLIGGRVLRWGVAVAFVLTFCITPFKDLFNNIQRDDDVNEWAAALKPLHLEGTTFITNADQNKLMRFAYLSGTSLSVYRIWDVTADALIDDIHRYKVNYYYEFNEGRPLLPCSLTTQLREVTGGKFPFVKIYRLY